MGISIQDIKLPDKDFTFISEDGSKGNVLKGLSKINIFIGENNSGKSRLMRSIIQTENFDFISTNEDLNKINDFTVNFKNDLKEFYNKYNLNDIDDLNYEVNKLKYLSFLKANESYFKPFKELHEHITTIPGKINITYVYKDGSTWIKDKLNQNTPELNELLQIYNKNKKFLTGFRPLYTFKKIYIPILRGLKPINYGTLSESEDAIKFSKDIYKLRILEDYPKLKNTCEIFTGLITYEHYTDYSGHVEDSKRELIKSYKELLSEIFNDEIDVTPVDPRKQNQLLQFIVKIGEEKGRLIHELGDGIQSIIIMTFPLFLHEDVAKKQNILIFIEEPEQLLHPSLQRKLVNVFLDERFDNYQFFLTTHSNHFLDISLDSDDVSIYSVSKFLVGPSKNKFFIKKVSFGDNELLELLGVRNSSVFNTNCNICVEGIVDQLYLRKYFKIYQDYMKKTDKIQKIFVEDRHFSFSRYNGDDIKNYLEFDWDKSDKIPGNLLIIMDGDKNGENAQNQHLKELFGDNFVPLDCWAIENLLSKKVLIETLKNNGKYKDIHLNEDFKESDYKNKDLNEFIKVSIANKKINYNPIKKRKRSFFEQTNNYIKNYKNLSKDAVKLCETLYKFIESQNTS
ncbi:MAG: ATP-binding protein [Veillonellaceae bacterium]|nr:ATP-binding protein [Veillonellaceae bacterium]